MAKNYPAILISIYKIIGGILRIIMGSIILYFKADLYKALAFTFRRELLEDPSDVLFYYISNHINYNFYILTYILAISLIILSILEIFFAIKLLQNDKSGAIGLAVISLLWIPLEILFLAKFLVVRRFLSLFINIIIIILLLWMIQHSRKYFKKN